MDAEKRRGIFKLAFAAPAVVAALPVGAALAHDDDDDDESTSPRASLLTELCTVSEVTATGRQDFVPAVPPNPQHPLAFGGVAVGHHHRHERHDRHDRHDHEHVYVVLRGARPRTTYDVFFAPHNNAMGRQLLGAVTTNRDGHFAGEPAAVPGAMELGGRRAGIFVLREAGTQQDQYVTCLHGHHHDHRFWRFFRHRRDD